MKRNLFIKNLFFGISAVLLPKVLLSKKEENKVVIKLGSGSFIIKNRNECETSMALTEEKIADLKLRHCILAEIPKGKYIDLRTLRAAYYKK